MVPTSIKFTLNETTHERKSVCACQNKAFDKKTRFQQPEKLFPLLGINKLEEN